MPGWVVGGWSSAVGTVVEIAGSTSPVSGPKLMTLRGWSVAVGTTAASTVPITLVWGQSSAAVSSAAIATHGSLGMMAVSGLDIRANYFGIRNGAAPTGNGVACSLWGDFSG